MSGPKAVRVVSREERIAQCNTLLAHLDAQISDWLRVGNRLGILSDEDRTGTEEKVSLLRDLIAADRFDQVERQTPVVVEFLRRDLDEKVAKHAEKKRRDKTVRRRLGIAAEQMLGMADAAGQDLDTATRARLESAAAGSIGNPGEVEQSINEAIAVLSSVPNSNSLSEDQQKLAESLQGGMKVQTVTEWVIENSQFDDDLATKVEGYIADLEVSESTTIAAPFAMRAEEIREISNRGKRRMLLDTLTIELAAEVKRRKRKRGLYTRAISLKTVVERDPELSGDSVSDQLAQLMERWNSIENDTAESLLDKAADIIKQREKDRDAQFRRTAMLEAFSELGYEIREGMETAWVEDKRVVVRKSAQMNHGVEVSGSAEGGRLQVRPVRFAAPGSAVDRQKDIDIETIWCSEFGALRRILDDKGGEIEIVRAKAVGEVPVKVVTATSTGDRRRESARPKSKKRST